MKSRLSIAIVTRKRPIQLRRCLKSIVWQAEKPSVVLVIDNDTAGSAQVVVSQFVHRLPIQYVRESIQGVPHARNRALGQVKTELLGFVDDDCVLEKHWVERARTLLSELPQVTYLVGNSKLLNSWSVLANAEFLHHNYWFEQKLTDNKNIPTAFNFDTKNVVIRVADIRKNKVRFDPSVSIGATDGSDTDFGFQLDKAGLLGVYDKKLVVYHEEASTFSLFLRKTFLRGKLAKLLADKWRLSGEFVDTQLWSLWGLLRSLRSTWSDARRYLKVPLMLRFHSLFFVILVLLALKIREHVFFFGFSKSKD